MSQRLVRSICGFGLLGVFGCGGDTTGPAALTPAQAYWSLQVNYAAVNMATVAPANRLQLIATPLNADGIPLTGLPAATFATHDTTVSVDSTGVLTGHYATNGISAQVLVSLRAQGVTLVDTVRVQVTDTIPQHPLTTFSMQPGSGDSARRALPDNAPLLAMQAYIPWSVIAVDVARDTICNAAQCALEVYYTASNPAIATIDPQTGVITASDTGHLRLTASTWVYGMAERDSVVLAIGYKLSYLIPITLSNQFGTIIAGFVAPKRLVLGIDATVTFQCVANLNHVCNHPVDIVFDNPAPIDTGTFRYFGVIPVPPDGSGNIPAFGGDSLNFGTIPSLFRTRRFPVPGIYRYHSTLFPSDTNEIEVKSFR